MSAATRLLRVISDKEPPGTFLHETLQVKGYSNMPLAGEEGTAISREGIRPAR